MQRSKQGSSEHQRGSIDRRESIKHDKWKVYSLIGILGRSLLILTSTSFIHPDEHFQSTQIAIEDVFKPSRPLVRTWEWDPARLPNQTIGGGPVRSIVPLWVTSHFGLRLLKLATSFGWINVSTRALVIAPRLVLFLLSICVDRLIFQTFQISEVQFLYVSSLSSSLFLCRTFSNSLESLLFITIFILSLSIANHSNKSRKNEILSIIIWTILNLFAVFVRVSYICFGLPLVLMILYSRFIRSFRLFTVAVTTTLVGSMILIYLDSFYFNRWPTIAPISLFLYNLNHQNLAQHGTHPYFLHLFVNGPILFGPALWFTSWWRIWSRFKSRSIVPNVVKCVENLVSMATVLSGTLLLSLQPHQEPRFLLPLTLPLVILSMTPKSRGPSKSKSQSRLSKSFWVVHLLHTIITVILFGYLHQGGLQLAMEALPPKTTMVFSYKTFDIPTSLIINHTQIPKVENLRGTTEEVLIEKLCEIKLLSSEEEVVLIAPRWSFSQKILDGNFFLLRFYSSIPHLDLDRLHQIYQAGSHRLGIGLYQIDHEKLLASSFCVHYPRNIN